MKFLRLFSLTVLLAGFSLPLSAYEGWMTDLDAGRAKAKAEGKQLVVEFTGSTWCPPCKSLHAEVLTSGEFAAWAADKVLVKLDYPRSSERTPEKIAANPELAKLIALKDEHAVSGFPTMFVFAADGAQQAKVTGYRKGQGPADYLAKLSR